MMIVVVKITRLLVALDASHLDGAFEEKVSEKIVINILLDIVNINLTNIDSNDE